MEKGKTVLMLEHHVMETYGEMERQFQILTSELHGDERIALCPGR
jgi:hypothetical protein